MCDFKQNLLTGKERVAKILARAGICSRREAECLIALGKIAVNGKTLVAPATRIASTDVISVNGVVITAAAPTRLWRYHKPRGVIVTHYDPKCRQTVFATLPVNIPRVVSVGRLDIASEGLLLLSNDGTLARFLELPNSGLIRRYRVRVHGTVRPSYLTHLVYGITIAGVTYGPIQATIDCVRGSNAWLTVSLCEGRNREIRTVMEAYSLKVSRLIRVAYGPFQLGNLPKLAVEEISPKIFRKQLGL